MERDKLKTSLNRTVEEKSKLIAEGDEHLEMITKKSEKEKRYIQNVKCNKHVADLGMNSCSENM